MTDGKKHWLVYYEPMSLKPDPLILNLPKANFTVEWINVVTGKAQAQQPFAGGQLYPPEGADDKLAVIRLAGKRR